MGEPRAKGAQSRMKLRSLTPLEGTATPFGPDGMAIAFLHSGSTAAIMDAAEMARRNRARTIAVTTYPESPLAPMVDVVLCSTAQNPPLLGENITEPIAQLNQQDALFVAMAQRDRKPPMPT